MINLLTKNLKPNTGSTRTEVLMKFTRSKHIFCTRKSALQKQGSILSVFEPYISSDQVIPVTFYTF